MDQVDVIMRRPFSIQFLKKECFYEVPGHAAKTEGAGQNTERRKSELTKIIESGKIQLHKIADLRADYMYAVSKFQKLKDEAFDHIKASEDPGSMRALYQVLMHNISWEAIHSMLLCNCCGMIFRTVAFDISSITM